MLKKFFAFFAAMYIAVSFAAVDVNKATAADLDGLKGIGPGISGKIVDERKKGDFKDWNDFIARVNGVGDKNAAKFSAEGMTVGGASYKGTAPTAKKDAKPAAVASAASVAAAPAATTAKDEKKAKAEEAKAKADAKKAAKADAKKAKAEEKAAAAKPAVSEPKK